MQAVKMYYLSGCILFVRLIMLETKFLCPSEEKFAIAQIKVNSLLTSIKTFPADHKYATNILT
jgi:hypothetical protein